MLYFSYGSNMSIKRLQSRVPSARFISTAFLCQHELRFHKESDDGSGKCDAYKTGRMEDSVWGVVFEIAADEKSVLDEKENLGHGYDEKEVTLTTPAGETLSIMRSVLPKSENRIIGICIMLWLVPKKAACLGNMSRGSDRLKRSKIQLTIGEQKKWQFMLPNSVL